MDSITLTRNFTYDNQVNLNLYFMHVKQKDNPMHKIYFEK
jgi:hypothetical protein